MDDVVQSSSSSISPSHLHRANDAPLEDIGNCWWDAASIAVVRISPWWIENLFYWPGGGPTLAGEDNPASNTVNVTIFDPYTYSPRNFTATIFNESTSEDNPGGCWWHSALSQGILELGDVEDIYGVNPNETWTLNTGSASLALAAMTGYPAMANQVSDYTDQDAFYNDLVKADTTPIVLSSNEQVGSTIPSQLAPTHDYAVMNATTLPNGTRGATLKNPWGDYEGYQLQSLMENCFYLHHLTEWNELNWPGH